MQRKNIIAAAYEYYPGNVDNATTSPGNVKNAQVTDFIRYLSQIY